MIKYLSGRVKRTPQDRLSADRYDYLDVKQAEPNLADPATSPPVPSGAQFQLVAVPGYPGKRYWVPVGGGLIPGAISIFDEGTLVSSASSITQLNFVGAAVTAQVSVQSPSGHPGIAATITVNPVTILDTPPINPISGELWWESDTGDLYVYYEDADSSQWVTTNTGGRGDPGADGDKGQKGEVGAQGLSGSGGVKGDKGQKGEIGDKGQKGDVEAKGNKGEKGEKGEKGIKGEKGEKGQKGEIAEKGQKGVEGEKGQKGIEGLEGSVGSHGDKAGLRYQYSHNTTMGDPGGGIFRYNNSSTLGSISAIAIDATTKEGTDVSDYIATWDDATNDTIKGHIIVKSNVNADATYTIFEVTAVTDNTGWLQITVQNATGNFPSNSEECVIQFYRTGNKGDKGQKGEKGTKGDKGDKGQKGSGTSISIADAAPGSANNGDLWWASDDFDLHVYYDDGDSSQWVSITSNTSLKGEKGEKGVKGEVGVKGQKGVDGADNSTKGQKGEDNSTKGQKGEVGQKGATGADNSTKGQKGEDNSTKGQKGEGDKGQKGDEGSAGSTGIPVGTITMFGSASAPSGWQLCNGGSAQTSALQSVVGSNVPDLRDRFVVGGGSSYSHNDTGGSANATLVSHSHTTNSTSKTLTGDMQKISECYNVAGTASGVFTKKGTGNSPVTGSSSTSPTAGVDFDGTHTHGTDTQGSSATNANLPPYYALCYIMKT